MASEVYIKEIGRLLSVFLIKEDSVMIMQTEKHKMGLGKESVIVFSTDKPKEEKRWEELNAEVLYDIYTFVETAVKMHPEVVSRVELDPADEKSWRREPEVIKSLDGTVLGRVGIANEEIKEEGKPEYSVILISPDGTWATLTMFGSDAETPLVAEADLKDIGLALMNFANNIIKKE